MSLPESPDEGSAAGASTAAEPTRHPLTGREAATIALRIMSVLAFYRAFLSATQVVAFVLESHGAVPSIYSAELVGLVICVTIGTVLWRSADSLAARLLPVSAHDSGTFAPAGAAQLLSASLAFLGILIFTVWGVPSAIVDVWLLVRYTRTGGLNEFAARLEPLVVRDVANCLVGLWLLLSATRLARGWQRRDAPTFADGPDEGPL